MMVGILVGYTFAVVATELIGRHPHFEHNAEVRGIYLVSRSAQENAMIERERGAVTILRTFRGSHML